VLDSGREDSLRGIRRGSLDGMKAMCECQLRGKDQGGKVRSSPLNFGHGRSSDLEREHSPAD
jgi:hypothetical protein